MTELDEIEKRALKDREQQIKLAMLSGQPIPVDNPKPKPKARKVRELRRSQATGEGRAGGDQRGD